MGDNRFTFNAAKATIDWPKDADNGLSYTKMVAVTDNRHPRKVNKNGTKANHSWCCARTGWHCSCKTWRDSDIRDLGVGISVYFKFLKYMMLLFLWFGFLSIPAYFLYYTGN